VPSTLSTTITASPIPVPEIDSDEPIVVIPLASVAPLEGPPDGERINMFAIAPKNDPSPGAGSGSNLMNGLRDRVLDKPLTYVAAAFSLGVLVARVLR
jgi:hypothetical protein